MAWVMRLPNNFGQFWPSGDFEYDPIKKESGWFDRLRRHYLAQTPEEQIRLYDYRQLKEGYNNLEWGAGKYETFPIKKFKMEIGTKEGPDSLPTTPVEVHEPPLTFDTDKPYASLGSMIMLNGDVVAVDDAFKKIIQMLEPEVHHSYPIKIKTPKGTEFLGQYFTLVIGQWFSSYLPERSDTSKKNFAGLVFSKEAFGDAHLWKDRGTPALTYFSDELRAEIEKAGLLIPKLYKVKVVIDNPDVQRTQGTA